MAHYAHSDTIVEIKNGDGVSYTVPQKFDLEVGEEQSDVFFRVNHVIKKGVITVSAEDGTVLLEKKKAHLLPAEMEKISLPKSLLQGQTKVHIRITRNSTTALVKHLAIFLLYKSNHHRTI